MILKLKVDSGRVDGERGPIFIEILVRDSDNDETVTADVREYDAYHGRTWTPIGMMNGELEVIET